MGKSDKQVHERKKNCLEHLQSITERAPRNFCSISLQEDMIEEGQEEDGLMFEDGTGQNQRLQMMMINPT
jgi:hypothetical protein